MSEQENVEKLERQNGKQLIAKRIRYFIIVVAVERTKAIRNNMKSTLLSFVVFIYNRKLKRVYICLMNH